MKHSPEKPNPVIDAATARKYESGPMVAFFDTLFVKHGYQPQAFAAIAGLNPKLVEKYKEGRSLPNAETMQALKDILAEALYTDFETAVISARLDRARSVHSANNSRPANVILKDMPPVYWDAVLEQCHAPDAWDKKMGALCKNSKGDSPPWQTKIITISNVSHYMVAVRHRVGIKPSKFNHKIRGLSERILNAIESDPLNPNNPSGEALLTYYEARQVEAPDEHIFKRSALENLARRAGKHYPEVPMAIRYADATVATKSGISVRS